MIEIFTDGLAEPENPGIGTYGYAIYRDGKLVDSGYGFDGDPVTNNHAEYAGLIAALEAASEFKEEAVVVKSDSKLLVNQMGGNWKVSKKASRSGEGSYYEKYLLAKEAVKAYRTITFEWIPREKNEHADELSRIAYREAVMRLRR